MSLRDYFAAAALPSIIAHHIEDLNRYLGNWMGPTPPALHCAQCAYNVADAMLAKQKDDGRVGNREIPSVTKTNALDSGETAASRDRKSTRLNSSHSQISYAV